MKGKRLWQTLRLLTYRSDKKRSEWLRKNDVFYSMGDNVSLNMKIMPLYPKLISFGNNVKVATGVTFVTHDVISMVLNNCAQYRYKENIGCIKVGDNVFIGAKSIIMPNVSIGSNVIIAAGTVVTKDIPDGEIWGGVPARRIGLFCEYMAKYKEICEDKVGFEEPGVEEITETRVKQEWAYFNELRN